MTPERVVIEGRREPNATASVDWIAHAPDAARATLEPSGPSPDLTVASYVFPHYHRSYLNDLLYGDGWTEHRLRAAARPWFEGHRQPRSPLLGELDEAQAEVMERYIDLAADHGVDAFIFDWYWYDGAPALHESLEHGFLRARNRDRLKFACMWCPHDWPVWTPSRSFDGSMRRTPVLYGPETAEAVRQSFGYLIARYLHQPNYWTIDGSPVIVVWELSRLEAAWGTENVPRELDRLRALARSLGHAGIHFHASSCGSAGRLGDFAAAGFDSYGHYNTVVAVRERVARDAPTTTLAACAEHAEEVFWPDEAAQSPLPYVTNIGVGWDDTPRQLRPPTWPPPVGWPGLPVVVEDDPAPFADFVVRAQRFIEGDGGNAPVLTIGCWNEWTENHCLLPDTDRGFGTLQALKHALGR